MNKSEKIILHIVLIPLMTIIIVFLSIIIIEFKLSMGDTDYEKLDLKIEHPDIEYSTVYEDDSFSGIYKVYKIKNYYTDRKDKFKNRLDASAKWNKEKYYEYIMQEFYEIKDGNYIYIDRENLYYYHGKDVYAIFDAEKGKLYYFRNRPMNSHNNSSTRFDIDISGYNDLEIYNVRGGPQGDGED